MAIERKEIDLRTFFAEKQDIANLKPGISNIALLNVNGKTKTYRITLSDNTHFDFNVADGADGSKGATGPQGPKGDKGDIGSAGLQGPKGDKGDTGATGPKGDKGDTGAKGDIGAQGPQGIQGVQGPQGDPFSIYKTYSSITAMNSDKNNVAEGKFVIISSNTNDEDNAKLYVKGASNFTFITDLSGATGIQGPQGIQGEQGPTGPKGDTGSQGPKGDKGDTGATGKGITKIQKTSTNGLVDTYTITYSDNTTTTFTVTNGADGNNSNIDLSDYATSSDLDDLQTYLEGLIDGIEEDMLQ